LADQRHIPPNLLEHRVDQHRLAARPVPQQVGVGRGLRVEQLTEYQHRSPRPSDGHGALRSAPPGMPICCYPQGPEASTDGELTHSRITRVIARSAGISYGGDTYKIEESGTNSPDRWSWGDVLHGDRRQWFAAIGRTHDRVHADGRDRIAAHRRTRSRPRRRTPPD